MNEYKIPDVPSNSTMRVGRQKRVVLDSTSVIGTGAIFVGTVLLYVVCSAVTHSKNSTRRTDDSATAEEFVSESLPAAENSVIPNGSDD